MTNYVDMTPDERLQAVKLLAKFCGYTYQYELAFPERRWCSKVRKTSDEIWVEWNPFLDATPRDEVEAVIREEFNLHLLQWKLGHKLSELGLGVQARASKEEGVPYGHYYGQGATKADALHAVVQALGERRQRDPADPCRGDCEVSGRCPYDPVCNE